MNNIDNMLLHDTRFPNTCYPPHQVVTNRDTQETLLCIAFVFEVSTSDHGAQYHVYRLVKDWMTLCRETSSHCTNETNVHKKDKTQTRILGTIGCIVYLVTYFKRKDNVLSGIILFLLICTVREVIKCYLEIKRHTGLFKSDCKQITEECWSIQVHLW